MYRQAFLLFLLPVWTAPVFVVHEAQAAEAGIKPKDVREIAKQGQSAIPRLTELLKHSAVDVRIEVVKGLTEIGTQRSLDPLIQACKDNDPAVQIHATDGLVNFYLPGYVQSGLGASLRQVGTSIKGKFAETNDQVIESYIQVRPEVVQAIGGLARGGSSMASRANAARAAGILRGKDAVPDLLAALLSKDSTVIYECLIAFQKIRDKSVGPKIVFLLGDLDEKVQIAALETAGLLRTKEAVPDLVEAVKRARKDAVRTTALTALAMIPDERSRPLFEQYLGEKDDGMRAAAAEGLGRLENTKDLPLLEKAFNDERKPSPRLSLAFALVFLGKEQVSEFSPLQLLINTLNSSSRKGVASGLLVELARKSSVRQAFYPGLKTGTKMEKVELARVLGQSGEKDSLAPLDELSHDGDAEVAQEALRALRSVKSRL